MAQPNTVNLSHEVVEAGAEALVTAQLRFIPSAALSAEQQAEIFTALNPVLAAVAQYGTVLAVSLSIQPYSDEEEDGDDDQAG